MPSYVFEVARYITEKTNLISGPKCRHVGYMDKKFTTRLEACNYYNSHNPHMRSLNLLENYVSDWDPHTKLLYILREDFDLECTIPPFEETK